MSLEIAQFIVLRGYFSSERSNDVQSARVKETRREDGKKAVWKNAMGIRSGQEH